MKEKDCFNKDENFNVDDCKLPPPIGKLFYREFIINCET